MERVSTFSVWSSETEKGNVCVYFFIFIEFILSLFIFVEVSNSQQTHSVFWGVLEHPSKCKVMRQRHGITILSLLAFVSLAPL